MNIFGSASQPSPVATQQPVALNSLRVQTSVYGLVLTVQMGTNRIPVNLSWYGDFTPVAHTTGGDSGGGGGGKGMGGGGGGASGSSTNYTYTASVQMLACEGPVDGFGVVWKEKEILSLAAIGFTVALGLYPQTPWTFLQTNHPHEALGYNGMALLEVANYDLGDNANLPNHTVEVRGMQLVGLIAADAKTITANPSTDTLTSVAHGFEDGATLRFTTTGALPGGILALTDYIVVNGTDDTFQLVANRYDTAVLDITDAGSGTNTATPRILDANPADIVTTILTGANIGAGFPSANLDALTDYETYCLAMGLLMSPTYDQQQDARQHLNDLIQVTNSGIFFSADKLKIVPFADAAVTGNGVTFTPDLTPEYDLADIDYLPGDDGDPVRCARSTPADAYNRYQVEHVDKNAEYNTVISEAKDQGAIDTFGELDAQTVTYHGITDITTGRLVAQLLMQRGLYVRNGYTVNVPIKYCLLEPMDLITLTDVGMGLDRQLCRILAVSEDDSLGLQLAVEQVDIGVASSPRYGAQGTTGFTAAINADPGDINTPLFFDAPVQLSLSNTAPNPGAAAPLVVYAAVSGAGADWGGCDVWISTDGSTYKRAGSINGPARTGVLTAPLPSSGDPDTTNTLSVNLTQSRGSMLSGTQADADNLRTPVVVDNELMAYETATLVDQYKYGLTYLRRGQLGTATAAHTAGAPFFVVDNAVFSYPYQKEQIGTTIYTKFLSFNLYGAQTQDISTVTAYPHLIVGPPKPGVVSNFSARQVGAAVQFGWTDIQDFNSLKGYDIGYAQRGTTDQSAFILLTEASRATEVTTVAVPPGTWTFAIWGHDIADQLGPISTYDLTVTNPDTVIYQRDEAPDWLGTLSGFLRHWTGVLVPDSSKLANQHTNVELFEQYVPYPVATSTYTTAVIDTGLDATVRVFATEMIFPGRGVVGIPAINLLIDHWLTGEVDPNNFQNWTIGQVTLRYLRARLLETAGSVPSYISSFIPTVDAAPTTQQSSSVVVAPGGTFVPFVPAFHSTPLVIGSVVGNTALIFSAQNPTSTGFTAHVFDKNGTDVGGTINWQATGT